jgi:hypothetical protein
MFCSEPIWHLSLQGIQTMSEWAKIVMAKCGCGFTPIGYYSFEVSRFIVEQVIVFPCGAEDCEARKAMRKKAAKMGFKITEPVKGVSAPEG